MKLSKIDFSDIMQVMYLMRRPFEQFQIVSREEEMVEKMKDSERKATFHVYPINMYNKVPGRLLDVPTFQQTYLALEEGKVFCSYGIGHGSGGRYRHNRFIELFLDNEELQKQVPTVVLVTHRKDAMAYYFHGSYAYMNHDIGINASEGLYGRVEESGLPFSHQVFDLGRAYDEIRFGEDKPIYVAMKEDVVTRRFNEAMEKRALQM